jgi:hypothetical protein
VPNIVVTLIFSIVDEVGLEVNDDAEGSANEVDGADEGSTLDEVGSTVDAVGMEVDGNADGSTVDVVGMEVDGDADGCTEDNRVTEGILVDGIKLDGDADSDLGNVGSAVGNALGLGVGPCVEPTH